MAKDYITFTIGPKKDIALIAHDNEKTEINRMVSGTLFHLKAPQFIRNRNHGTDDYRPDRTYRKRL